MLLQNMNFCAVRESDLDLSDPKLYTLMELVADLTHHGYTIFNNEDFEAFENRCEDIAQLFAMKDEVKALAACKQLISEITSRVLP